MSPPNVRGIQIRATAAPFLFPKKEGKRSGYKNIISGKKREQERQWQFLFNALASGSCAGTSFGTPCPRSLPPEHPAESQRASADQ